MVTRPAGWAGWVGRRARALVMHRQHVCSKRACLDARSRRVDALVHAAGDAGARGGEREEDDGDALRDLLLVLRGRLRQVHVVWHVLQQVPGVLPEVAAPAGKHQDGGADGDPEEAHRAAPQQRQMHIAEDDGDGEGGQDHGPATLDRGEALRGDRVEVVHVLRGHVAGDAQETGVVRDAVPLHERLALVRLGQRAAVTYCNML